MTVIKELSPKNVLQKLFLGQKLKYEAVFLACPLYTTVLSCLRLISQAKSRQEMSVLVNVIHSQPFSSVQILRWIF